MPRLLLLTPGELSRDPRARRAALAARARGWDVVGLCGQMHGDEPVPLDSVPIERVAPGERMRRARGVGGGVVRDRALGRRELRGLYQLLRLATQTIRLRRAGARLGRFDVIHANDLDTLPAGWLLARSSGARLVYDAHELYTAQEADPPRLHRAVVARLERMLARRAHAVATVSQPLAEELRSRLGLARRPLVVLNCPAREDGAEPAARAEGPLAAIYQAGAALGRPLDDLLAAAPRLEDVELTLRVSGVDADALRAEVTGRGLERRVRVADPVRADRVVAALHGFDVGLVIDRPVSRNNELGFPNKLFEYLMAGLAVVVPRLETMGAFVEAEGVGLTFDPGEPDSLAAALNDLARDRERLLSTRRRARELALTRYNAEAQSETLVRAWGS